MSRSVSRIDVRTVTMLAGLLLVTVLVYLPGLGGPLLLDDRANLAPLAAVGDGRMSAWDFVMEDRALFRPLARATFLLDWWLWGDRVSAFKSTNLALHLAAGVLVFMLARGLFSLRTPEHATAAALWVSALWLLAPMLLSTVLFTVQRMAQLSAVFCLAGLLCYVHGRRRGDWRLVIAAFVVFWPLATLSKENGALLPLLVASVEWWWFTTPDPMSRRVRRILLVLIAAPAALAAMHFALNPGWITDGYQGRDFGLLERVLTQPRMLADYLANLLLVPGASPLGLLRDDVVASHSLLDPPTTLASLVALGCGVVAAFASRRTRFAPVGFGIAFFLAGHALESSVFALELYFEHRNYLPAVGVYMAVGALVAPLLEHRRRAAAVLGLLVLALLAVLTSHRALIWGTEQGFYAHAVETHPDSARAWLGHASNRFAAGDFDAGDAALDRAADLLPDEARAGIALQRLGARCAAGVTPAPRLYQGLETAGVIGADLYTVNALAWMAGAVAEGRCVGLDRARLDASLARLPLVPVPYDPPRGALRGQHLERLRNTLR